MGGNRHRGRRPARSGRRRRGHLRGAAGRHRRCGSTTTTSRRLPRSSEAHSSTVEGWLFTRIVPYMLASDAEALTRPAAFVDYSGRRC
ncbi:hypothetical protein [Nonomuraea dietziae]|uniref:hypothetical protein n=1 Tax=Nonomuraea dietziae TaxID=65515 RepID=UPI0031DA1064